jgi:large repetitive protein
VALAVASVPAAPTEVMAVETGPGEASVSFTAPASNGAPIEGYTLSAVSSDGGSPVMAAGTESPITATGLTLGKIYTFTVTAHNRVGAGPTSVPSEEIVLSKK